MKKILVIPFICFAVLVSCGKKNNKIENPAKDTTKVEVKVDSLAFEVDTFHVVETEKKCPNDDCTTCDLYYERIRTCLKPVHDSVNMFMDTLVMRALSNMGGDEFKYDLKKRFESFTATKREFESEDMESGGQWDYTLNATIYRPCNEIMTVSAGYGGYTGGAHGNYSSEIANFFVSTGKRVTMSDIFNDLDAVNKLAVKYFKKDNQLDENVDLMEQGWAFTDEEFELNENFDINTANITWQYNFYEIGPYAAGAPSVTIPMVELQKYMKIKFTDVTIQ